MGEQQEVETPRDGTATLTDGEITTTPTVGYSTPPGADTGDDSGDTGDTGDTSDTGDSGDVSDSGDTTDTGDDS